MPWVHLHDLSAVVSNAFGTGFVSPLFWFDLQVLTVWEEKGEVLMDSRSRVLCPFTWYQLRVRIWVTPELVVHELIAQYVELSWSGKKHCCCSNQT